jgi:hypothetical protein
VQAGGANDPVICGQRLDVAHTFESVLLQKVQKLGLDCGR